MKDVQVLFKSIMAIILILASIALGIWLCLWVLLYGGIMQAVENFGTNNSAVVWGIIKAIFSTVGMIPTYIGVAIGYTMLQD